MNKQPQYLIVVVLYSIIAVVSTTSTALSGQSGMAVWGNVLSIHSSDTLLAQGNVYLFNANVSGNGTLLLKDTSSRHIWAHNSNLPHLIIQNTDTVSLHGDLHIRSGLTLAQGVFDTRAGRLELADTAFVNRLSGGRWLRTDSDATHWLSIIPLLPPNTQQVLSIAYFSPPSSYNVPACLGQQHSGKIPLFAAPRPLQVWLRIPYPPPKTGAGEPAAPYTLQLRSTCFYRCYIKHFLNQVGDVPT